LLNKIRTVATANSAAAWVPSMDVYAIVPVKKIGVSKRRLSQCLSTQERKALTVAMLEDVLQALKASKVSKVLVVSNDPNVQPIAEQFGVFFFSPIRKGLNAAVEEAFVWCMKNKADSVLVLPSDIPLISSTDINAILTLGSNDRRVVLVPSKDWGTNAFFQCPPHLVHACFGSESFKKHVNEAIRKGASVKFYYSLGAGLDIDSIDDLQVLRKTENSTLSKKVLYRFDASKSWL
jgi:2-phospho-L-lactate/phosphoenolpyruvate guanylyltransferase